MVLGGVLWANMKNLFKLRRGTIFRVNANGE